MSRGDVALFCGRVRVRPEEGRQSLMEAIRGRCAIDMLGETAYVKLPGNDPTTYRVDFGGDEVMEIVMVKDRNNRSVSIEVW